MARRNQLVWLGQVLEGLEVDFEVAIGAFEILAKAGGGDDVGAGFEGLYRFIMEIYQKSP